MARRWVIAGGGTGGHVMPALALGEVIVEHGDEVLFVGAARGLEARLVPEAGFDLEVLPSEHVMGRSLWGRIRGGLSILRSVGAARALLSRFAADVVVSVGGYAAMPTAIAARTRGVPLFLVEPNAIPGRVNRLTARFARAVFLGLDSARAHLPARTEALCVGVPLRHALCRAFEDVEPARRPSGPLRIFVFGGSQGARQLNESVPAALARLPAGSVEVFHQTGEAERAQVEARYAETGVPAIISAFEHDMPGRYRWADLAICRAGALTVAELCLAGMPALLLPYPFAADDHQTANARALEEAGAARLLDTRPVDVDALTEAVKEVLEAPERLIEMHRAARSLARPRAADEIFDLCRARLDGSSREPDPAEDAGTKEARCSAS